MSPVPFSFAYSYLVFGLPDIVGLLDLNVSKREEEVTRIHKDDLHSSTSAPKTELAMSIKSSYLYCVSFYDGFG